MIVKKLVKFSTPQNGECYGVLKYDTASLGGQITVEIEYYKYDTYSKIIAIVSVGSDFFIEPNGGKYYMIHPYEKEKVIEALEEIRYHNLVNNYDNTNYRFEYFKDILNYCISSELYESIPGLEMGNKIYNLNTYLRSLKIKQKEVKPAPVKTNKVESKNMVTYEHLENVLLEKFDRDDIDDILLVIKKEFYKDSEELTNKKYKPEDMKNIIGMMKDLPDNYEKAIDF